MPPEERDALRNFQDTVRRRIRHGAQQAPITNYGAPKAEEHAALRAAVQEAIATWETEDTASVRVFEARLAQAVADYLADFHGGGPAFMFVRTSDWRWMLALAEAPPSLHVVHHEQVSSREVLLLANDSGKALLVAHDIPLTGPDLLPPGYRD
jgi:hypothetical protein